MFTRVADLKNNLFSTDNRRTQMEMMKGRYEVNMSSKLSLPKKIVKFAYEPVAFYLHKKRDFINRLDANYEQRL